MTTSPGLRERKKARTRWAIQEHALRLFEEQGYEATTVDQIAAAADVSASTFFRYFPTKEDVVVRDEYDDLFVTAFTAAGASATPIAVLRGLLGEVVGSLPQSEWAKASERAQLVLAVPALRARSMDNFTVVFRRSIEAFALAAGRPADDLAVEVLVGACLGALMATALSGSGFPGPGDVSGVLARMDHALALLEGIDWTAG